MQRISHEHPNCQVEVFYQRFTLIKDDVTLGAIPARDRLGKAAEGGDLRSEPADFDGSPQTSLLPLKKARPAHGHPIRPKCVSPDSEV